MSHYIDGFVFSIAKSKLSEYQNLASEVANIWCEHGAIHYQEFVGDELNLAGTKPFPATVNACENDVVIFGWVMFTSKAQRNLVHQMVAKDPRMFEVTEKYNTGFDPSKMLFGGFTPFVDCKK